MPEARQRLLSLDFMRGFIMVLLALESAGLYEHLSNAAGNGPVQPLLQQFFHHPWHGLHFWDLVQPAFMFMAGTALAYSLTKQQAQGVSWKQSFQKALRRSGWLFFWGVFDYAVTPEGLRFALWDVLTQLSFTTLLAFLIFRWKPGRQILACVALLVLTEVLYRCTNVPNFNQPFTDQHNFGNYIDLLLMHTINPGGWVAINCIPTAVHTIAGTLAGKLLLNTQQPDSRKPLLLLGWALACLVVGYGIDLAGITPIIKRIATSSFTLASLGWCLAALALCYWWIDVRAHRRYLQFFTIVGMNALFIYLFFEIVGSRWFNGYITTLVTGMAQWIHLPELPALLLASATIFMLEWGMCYFLYRKKIFFRA